MAPVDQIKQCEMRSLPDVFRTITDPRSRYGRRYRLETLRGGHAVRRPGLQGDCTSRRRPTPLPTSY